MSLAEKVGWPHPATSALYNFERIGDEHARTLDLVFPRWASLERLWDYSAASVLKLAARGLAARHVPLGYAETLFEAFGDEAPRDVDVLFVGRLNARRRGALRALRKTARVFHGNADGPAFGDDLRSLLARAKVVLSLNYFGDADEWKMTRVLPAIAAGAVVVAEAGGAPAEAAAWAGAVAFVDGGPDELAATVAFYLENATARVERAAAARAILESRRMASALRAPADALVSGACGGWRAAAVAEPAGWFWEVLHE